MALKKKTIRPGRDSDQFIVRLPEGMRAHLAEVAARNGRSMNAEVVAALAFYFAEVTTGEPQNVSQQLSSLQTKMNKLMEEIVALRKRL